MVDRERYHLFTGTAEQFLKCGGRWPPVLKWRGGRGGGKGKFGCPLFSLVIVGRSHLYKFHAAEKYLSPAEADCTCRIHQ